MKTYFIRKILKFVVRDLPPSRRAIPELLRVMDNNMVQDGHELMRVFQMRIKAAGKKQPNGSL